MLARAGLPSTLRPKPVALKHGRFVRATCVRRSPTAPWTNPQASLQQAAAEPREQALERELQRQQALVQRVRVQQAPGLRVVPLREAPRWG